MPKRKLSDEVRWSIVTYHKEKMVYQDIAKKCGVSWNCVNNTINRYEETGDIKEKKSSGRPRSTSKRDDQKLLRLAREDPFKSLRKLAQEWTVDGTPIGIFKFLDHFTSCLLKKLIKNIIFLSFKVNNIQKTFRFWFAILPRHRKTTLDQR